jgi:SAM-dependent methyltransferase
MKINAGCGGRYLADYTNVDIAPAPGKTPPDILCDLRSIPLADGCADEVMAIHVLEHFYRWEVDDVLREWKRLLRPGGLLVLELPDIMKCCRAVLSGTFRAGKHPDQAGMWGIYGDPRDANPYMGHKWGWHPKTLRDLLTRHEFIDINDKETQWHPVGRTERDMRMEARKP